MYLGNFIDVEDALDNSIKVILNFANSTKKKWKYKFDKNFKKANMLKRIARKKGSLRFHSISSIWIYKLNI